MRRVTILLLAALAAAANAQAGTADNVRTAKRVLLQLMGEGRLERPERTFGPNFVAHAASVNHTLQEDLASTQSWRTAMPDLKVTIERTVAGADMVAVHWLAKGTNTVAIGEMPGKGDPLGIEGMTIFRFEAGRIVEEWSVLDVAALRKVFDRR
jgi:predicted ester cyclase